MMRCKIAAYIIPSTDPHQSEYVPACWRRRAFVSGFTGSAGDLVVTRDKAGLWTDSRYFLQAEEALYGSGIDLFRQGLPGTPEIPVWIGSVLTRGETVGIDPKLFSHRSFDKMVEILKPHGIDVARIEENPVDLIWTGREPLPVGTILVHPDALSGESVQSKLLRLRRAMGESHADAHVLTSLDAIAWLFNIRGSDVPFTPVTIAYAIIRHSCAHLFVDVEKVTPALTSHLQGLAEIGGYGDFVDRLPAVAEEGTSVLLDPETVSQWIVDRLSIGRVLIFKRSPITAFKAVKNVVELYGSEAAHLRDGVAMVRFLSWLERKVAEGGVTELLAAEKLTSLRAEGAHFRGESFSAISAFNAHGAIVHYEPDATSDIPIEPPGIYLIDSGAQYLDGTTDITRTVAIGVPTAHQKTLFTRVLKGHIDLADTPFPEGTSGSQLDTIARRPLWEAGLNYGHGTGHGVGAYLGVHEGPHAISYYRGVGIPLRRGMIMSVEPGFYQAGAFGIRIENLVQVVADEALSTESTPFLRLKPLTLCPIDLALVDASLMSDEEIRYLDAYHTDVRERLMPFLAQEDAAWLKLATRPVER